MGKRYKNWIRWSDLLSYAAMSRVEAVVAGILLLGLGLVVFGPHVARGDFSLDDWAFRADYAQHGYWGLTERLLDLEPGLSEPAAGGRGRLLGTLFYATSYAALGSGAAPHLLLALLLGVLMSFLLFLVLRKLQVERLHAGLIAGLVLVFPAADAPRFWPAAAPAQLAIALFLLGLLLALGAFERSGRAAAVRHAASVVCYVLALLTYEYPFVAILLAVFVYRLKAPWRPSLRRWIVDVGAAALVAGYSRFVARASDVAPLSTQIDNARAIQDHARTLLSRLGIQDGQALVPLELLVLLLAAAGALAFLLPLSDPFRQDLRRWVVTAFAGIVAVGAGYVVLLPIEGHLPLNPGVANRINIGAAIGYVLVIYALAVLFGTLILRAVAVVRLVPQPRVWAGLVGAALTLFVGALWTAAAVDDRRDWERAGELRRETLDSLREVPRPRPSSTVYTFGVPGATAPGIFTFAAPYDLIGAVRVLWDDHSLAAIPAPNLERDFWGVNTGDNWGISCTPSAVRPHGYGYSEEDASPFGSVVFVDVPGGRHVVVRDRDECRAWASRYQLLRN